MKLSYEDKLKIYNEWKNENHSINFIAKKMGLNTSSVKYMLKLMDRYGHKIIIHGKNKYYSPEFKLKAINRVLINNETIYSVSLDLCLKNRGMLSRWIHDYKENGYNIIERKKRTSWQKRKRRH